MAAHQARYGRRGVRSARLPSITTRLHSQLTRNSPCSQSSRKRLVVSTCVCAPVSGSQFLEMLVRTDSCMAAVVRDAVFMAGSPQVLVCMGAMVGSHIFSVHVHFSENRI